MRFEFTLDEIIYIKTSFGFSKLLCVEDKEVSDSLAKSLEERQIITKKGSYSELSGEYRLLFKHWSQMRFSVINPAAAVGNKFYCILANYDAIIVYRQIEENVTVDFYDFDEHVMDTLIAGFIGLNVKAQCDAPFVQTFSMYDFNRFLDVDTEPDYLALQKETGIQANLYETCLAALATRETNSFLIEDHVRDIGCMACIANTSEGIAMLKHVTPPDPNNEKMVLTWGNAKYTVDCIYVF